MSALDALQQKIADKTALIGIVGLGYVGLPLAVHLARHFRVIGYDRQNARIEELKSGQDRTLEVTGDELAAVSIDYTDRLEALFGIARTLTDIVRDVDERRIGTVRRKIERQIADLQTRLSELGGERR